MSEKVDISVNFAGVRLENPVLTASGTCGYADELADFMDVNLLGGLITKSITPRPRPGNATPRIVETDSGMLNAIGLANIGLERFVSEKLPLIEQLSTAVFVNVAGETIEDYIAVTSRLAGEKGISGFELNISCPNVKQGGITFGTDTELISEITSSVKAVTRGQPLIVKLTPTVTDISVTARAAVEAGADALSLINTFTAMVIDVEQRRPVLANRTGGLSGPAIKPIAVYMVNKVYNEVGKNSGIPILGGGGIRSARDALEFIIAGATAVSVGTANFVEPDCCKKIIAGIKKHCIDNEIYDVKDLIGCLQ
jgi:dihydroorotate dehydrogenase (NAD+) catalytic subunit